VLEGAGIAVLSNRAVTLTAEGQDRRLWLVGIDDPVSGKADLEKAFADVPAGEPVLALVHSPDAAAAAIGRGAAAVLCGHTHGGQINVPLVGPLWANIRSDRALARGLNQVEGGYVYTNRGIGTSILP